MKLSPDLLYRMLMLQKKIPLKSHWWNIPIMVRYSLTPPPTTIMGGFVDLGSALQVELVNFQILGDNKISWD